MSITKISIRKIKAARELLGWSQDDMAEMSGVSKPTIARIESSGEFGGREETREKILAALTAAGIEFTHDGVRLKRKS